MIPIRCQFEKGDAKWSPKLGVGLYWVRLADGYWQVLEWQGHVWTHPRGHKLELLEDVGIPQSDFLDCFALRVQQN